MVDDVENLLIGDAVLVGCCRDVADLQGRLLIVSQFSTVTPWLVRGGAGRAAIGPSLRLASTVMAPCYGLSSGQSQHVERLDSAPDWSGWMPEQQAEGSCTPGIVPRSAKGRHGPRLGRQSLTFEVADGSHPSCECRGVRFPSATRLTDAGVVGPAIVRSAARS